MQIVTQLSLAYQHKAQARIFRKLSCQNNNYFSPKRYRQTGGCQGNVWGSKPPCQRSRIYSSEQRPCALLEAKSTGLVFDRYVTLQPTGLSSSSKFKFCRQGYFASSISAGSCPHHHAPPLTTTTTTTTAEPCPRAGGIVMFPAESQR